MSQIIKCVSQSRTREHNGGSEPVLVLDGARYHVAPPSFLNKAARERGALLSARFLGTQKGLSHCREQRSKGSSWNTKPP
jgi:hypothetical protein